MNDDVLTQILRAYDLDTDCGVEVRPLPQGFGGSVVRLRVGENDIVIKTIPDVTRMERTEFGLQLQRQLHAAGVPCPRPYLTRSGSPFVKVAGSIVTVHEWCPGEHFDVRTADAETRREHRRKLGALLGQIHSAASPQLLQTTPVSSRISSADLFLSIPRPDRIMRWSRAGKIGSTVWMATHLPRETRQEFAEALRLMKFGRDKLIRSPLAYDNRFAELLPVHGDVHFDNILMQSGRITGLVDFDNACVCPRAFDLGSTLAVACADREHEQDFLEAYADNSGGVRYDDELIRACVMLRAVRSMAFQITRYTGRNTGSPIPDDTRLFIRQLIRTMEIELANE